MARVSSSRATTSTLGQLAQLIGPCAGFRLASVGVGGVARASGAGRAHQPSRRATTAWAAAARACAGLATAHRRSAAA